MDWFSRYVLSWEVSNSLDSFFCLWALERALEFQVTYTNSIICLCITSGGTGIPACGDYYVMHNEIMELVLWHGDLQLLS